MTVSRVLETRVVSFGLSVPSTLSHFFFDYYLVDMSDSDEAFSDELLELAGATDKKRKRRQNGAKGSKRRKAECVLHHSIVHSVSF